MEHSLSATGFYAEPPLSPAPVPRGDASQRAPGFTASPPRSLAPVVELPRAVAAPAPAPAAEPEAKAPSLERMLLKFALLTPAQLGDAMREESATGRPLWEIVQERGWVSREDLIRLAERSSNAGDAVGLVPVPQVVPLAQPLAAAVTPLAEALPARFPDFTQDAQAPAQLPTPLPDFTPAAVRAQVEPASPPVAFEAAPPTFSAPGAELDEVAAPEPEPTPAEPPVSAAAEPMVAAPLEPAHVAAAAAETVPVTSLEVAAAPAAQTERDEELEAETATAFRVVLRLTNGERIEAQTCNGAVAARSHAEEFIRGLAAGPERWPYVSERFIRPESIVSVDIERSL